MRFSELLNQKENGNDNDKLKQKVKDFKIKYN